MNDRVKAAEKAGYPRFQGHDRYDSFTYPQGDYSLTHDTRVSLYKIGSVKVKLHRPLEGTIKTCTFKREGDHWYVVFACEVQATPRLPSTDDAIGIDLGLSHFATLPTGDTIDNPRYFRCGEVTVQTSSFLLYSGHDARRRTRPPEKGKSRATRATQSGLSPH